MRSVVFVTFLYFYLFSVKFIFFPISTRVLIAGLGILLITIKSFKNQKVSISKYPIIILLVYILIAVYSTLTISLNSSWELQKFKYIGSIVIIILAAYFVKEILNTRPFRTSIIDLSNYFLAVLVIESIVTWAMFLVPGVSDFVYTIISLTEDEVTKLAYSSSFRLSGMGSRFFTAGTIYGIVMIYIYGSYRSMHKSPSILVCLCFLFCMLTALAQSRIFALSMLIILICSLTVFILEFIRAKLSKFDLVTGSKMIFLLMFLVLITFVLFRTNLLINNLVTLYVLEMLFNSDISTASTNRLFEMYRFDWDVHTLLYGDGRYFEPGNDYTYYQKTDVGYIRELLFGGIIGMLLFLTVNGLLVRYAASDKFTQSALFLYFLMLNFKGLVEFSPWLMILILYSPLIETFDRNKSRC